MSKYGRVTSKIVGFTETCGDVFYTVEQTDDRGTHTEKFSSQLLSGLLFGGVKFIFDTENEALVEKLLDDDFLKGYIELARDRDSETEEVVFDIYEHFTFIDVEDGEITVDSHGKCIKTYKRYASAKKFVQNSFFKTIKENY